MKRIFGVQIESAFRFKCSRHSSATYRLEWPSRIEGSMELRNVLDVETSSVSLGPDNESSEQYSTVYPLNRSCPGYPGHRVGQDVMHM
ncbi:hypothetical protein PM082_023499 [Marasmius tenuissimus]|nr:hypothetical protein PM082_023499 [Marasmius tenuissimus]